MGEVQSKGLNGLSRRLAEFAVSFELRHAPAEVLENAKIAVLDCLGVAILAVSQEIGHALLSYARANCSTGPCTVWGSRVTANSRDAAFLNGTLAHGLDFDDRGHASTYTLASAIAAAECCNASGAATIEAFIAGREVRMCLDTLFARRSSGEGPGARGWHSNGILGPIASACAASKIFGLDVQHTLTAIGLAAGSCGALTRDGGTMAKPFRAGHAAAAGLTCALLAKEGFTSDETPLEGPYGLLAALGPLGEDVLDSLGKDLGTHHDLVTRGVEVKQFASCTATHAAVEAMLRLVQKRPVQPSEVNFIECDLRPYPALRTCPQRGFEGRFSVPFCLAIALIFGRLNPEDFSDERARDRWVRSLIERCRHAPGLKSLVVCLNDGTRLSEPIRRAENIKGWEKVREKFNRCVGDVLPDRQRAMLTDLVAHLEDLPSVRELTKSLCLPTS